MQKLIRTPTVHFFKKIISLLGTKLKSFLPIGTSYSILQCTFCFSFYLFSPINYNIDRPTKHSLPLTTLTNFSSEWKLGVILYSKKNTVCSVLVLVFLNMNLSFFMKQSKTNKDKSIVISPPPLLKPSYIYAHVPRAKKGQQKVPTLKKTTGLCPSSFVITLWSHLTS